MPYAPPGHERECDVGAEQGLPAFAAQRAEQAAVARLPCAHLAANTAINAAAAPRFDTALIPAPFGWWHGNLRGTSGRLGSGCSSACGSASTTCLHRAKWLWAGSGRRSTRSSRKPCVDDRNLRRRRLAPRPTAHAPRCTGPLPTRHGAHAHAARSRPHPRPRPPPARSTMWRCTPLSRAAVVRTSVDCWGPRDAGTGIHASKQ